MFCTMRTLPFAIFSISRRKTLFVENTTTGCILFYLFIFFQRIFIIQGLWVFDLWRYQYNSKKPPLRTIWCHSVHQHHIRLGGLHLRGHIGTNPLFSRARRSPRAALAIWANPDDRRGGRMLRTNVLRTPRDPRCNHRYSSQTLTSSTLAI